MSQSHDLPQVDFDVEDKEEEDGDHPVDYQVHVGKVHLGGVKDYLQKLK